jgi:hypothetical protein
MLKHLLFLSILIFAATLTAQNDRYTATMLATLEKLEQAGGKNELLGCASQFERIALAEKSYWKPYYYGCYALTMLSYDEPDGTKRDNLLDRAQEMLDSAFSIAPLESELHVLQSFLYPSRILVDPMNRGMVYLEKCFASLDRAKELNPNNPRAYFLEGINRLNMPPSMGGGADVAEPIFVIASEKFKRFHSSDPLWPDWGEEANLAELKKL